jgi:hypothetical protein
VLKWVFWRVILVVLHVMLVSTLMTYCNIHKSYHKKIMIQRMLFTVFFVSYIFLLVWFVMCNP